MLFGCGLEERQASNGGEVDRCDVGVIRGSPFLRRLGVPEFFFQLAGGSGVGDSFGARDTGGGDEEGEVAISRGDFLDEFFEGFFGGDIRADWDNLARGDFGIGAVLFGSVLEDFLAAACDVYFGTWSEE